MIFKNPLGMKITGLTLLFMITFGCVQDKDPYDLPLDIRTLSERNKCLDEVGTFARSFLSQNLSEAEIEEFWNCTERVVRFFQTYTRGHEDGSYTSLALKSFLEKFFIRSFVISPELLSSAMDVKVLFLGGSNVRLTREEVELTLAFLQLIKEVSLRIYPHLPHILSPNSVRAENDEELERGLRDLNVSLKQVSAWLEVRSGEYKFQSFRTLITEIMKLSPDVDGREHPLSRVLGFIPVFEMMKDLLVSPGRHSIKPQDWQVLVEQTQLLVELILSWERTLKSKDRLVRNTELLLQFLQRPLQFRSVVDREILVELLLALQMSGWVPQELTHASLTRVVDIVLNRILDPEHSSGKVKVGYTEKHLGTLENYVGKWRVVEERLIAGVQSLPEDFIRWIRGPWPLVSGDRGELIFDRDRLTYDVQSLRRWNWQRSVVDLMFSSYSQDRQVLLEEDIQFALSEFDPIFRDMGWDVSNWQGSLTQFLGEANLFLPRGDGNESLTDFELAELLAFVYSSWIQTDKIMKASADHWGGQNEAQAILENYLLQAESSFSDLSSILVTAPKSLRSDFFAKSWSISGVKDGEVTQMDVLSMLVLWHYLESVFFRFDVDRSQKFSLEEVLRAFPIFEQKLLAITGDSELTLPLFTFMMKHGQTPFSMLGGGVLFEHWRRYPDRWNLSADRWTVLGVLSALAAW